MEIVERGTLPEERTHTARCKHCQTLVRFLQKEAKKVVTPTAGYLVVECPLCETQIWEQLR